MTRLDNCHVTYDAGSRLVVIQRPNGEFWTGYRLPQEQLDRCLMIGRIGFGS